MIKKIFSVLLSCSVIFSGLSLLPATEAKASSYNRLSQQPLMGWSSWSSIRKHPSEQNLKAAADVLAAKFKKHGYNYVNLDDYYQLDWSTDVDRYGRWEVDQKKFPHGMKALGDYIHQKGLKFGLYVTPGIPKGAVDKNTPILGTPYHAKDIVDLSKGQKLNFNFKNMYFIDFSKPGAQEYINSWAKLFASYGVDYLKIDGVQKGDVPDIEAWAKALKKTGRPIHVELSNNLDIHQINTWKKLSNGWRTSHDVESYGKPTLTDWEHVSRRFEQAAKWQPYAGPGGWNDFDSLNVANGSKDGLTKDEKRSYVSLWAIAASQFVIGDDLTKLDDYGVSLLTNDEIIAANQSGVAGKRLSKTSVSQVFYQKLFDGSYNIGLFNTSSAPQTVSVDWKELGMEGSVMIRDMWTHRDLGSMETGLTTRLGAHASRMIHVIPASTQIVNPKSGTVGVNPASSTLIWTDASPAGIYHVSVAADPSFQHIVSDQVVSAKYLNVSNLDNDTKYYWKVSALSDDTETPIGVYSFHTKMSKAPDAPDWVLAERSDPNSVELSWNPSFGATSYTVYRKKENFFGGDSFTSIAVNVSEPNYMDDTAGLDNGYRYSYVVTAKNVNGESVKSIHAQTDDPAKIPVAVPLLGCLFFIIILSLARKKSKPIVYS